MKTKPSPPHFPEKPHFPLPHLTVTIYIPPECCELWISGKHRQSRCRARWKQKLLQTQQGNLEFVFNCGTGGSFLAVLGADTDHRGGSSSKRQKTSKCCWVINVFENRSLSLGRKKLQNQGGTHRKSTRDIWREDRDFLQVKVRAHQETDRPCQNKSHLWLLQMPGRFKSVAGQRSAHCQWTIWTNISLWTWH